MSDRFEQSDDNTDRVAGKSMKASQSAWMAHWGSTSYKPGTETHTRLDIELKEDYDDIKKHHLPGATEMETDDSVFSKGCREVSEGKRVDMVTNGMKHSPQFPLLKFAQQRDSVLDLNNLATYTRGELLKSQIDLNHGFKSISPTESEIPSLSAQAHHDTGTSRDCYTMPYYPEKHMKSSKFFETGTLASTYIQDDVGSSSKIVPHRYDSKRTQMSRKEEGNKATPSIASQEHCEKSNNFSTFLIHEKRVHNNLDFTRSGTSFLKRKDVPLLFDDPLLSDNKLPVFGGEQFEKMQHSSGRKPQSAKDPDIMSIHSTFGPKNGEPAKFSRTQNFPIKNKTDLNLSGGGQRSRDSPFSSKLKGKMFSEFFHLSSDFSFNGHQGVNMQPIGSSADVFGKNNVGNVKTSAVCIRNESSAETDTMNMDDLQKKHTFSFASSSSNKKMKATQTSTTTQTADALPKDELAGLLNAELPDINQEPTVVGERPSSMNDMETSTSRTQSLDVECLLSNAEQPTSSKSGDSGGFPSIEEFGSRWVKRLRTSASGSFGHGTKRSKASSHEEKSSCKSVKCSKSNSEPSSPEIYGNTLMTLRPTANVLDNNRAVALSRSTEKGHYVTPLHYWIRRWCHNDVAPQQKSPEASEICETQNPDGAVYPFRKKQFPSIGAMALMGKALNGFTPCEVEKRGSLLVWNTKGP